MKQKTIKRSFEIKGIGLHYGGMTSIIFHPAAVNSGIIIKAKNKTLPLDVNNVVSTNRGTDISFNDYRISTIEHMLASIKGLGIDNIIIEINGNEAPILDGSSKIFCEEIIKNGIINQNKEKKEIKIKRQFLISNNGRYIACLPSDSFKVYYFLDFSSYGIKPDFWGGRITTDFFLREIAPCRTFGFKSEVDMLRKQGLIKGATSRNAVLIDKGKPVNTKLRFKNELLRHKILDIIGDLSYIQGYLKICIIAYKTGHTENIMMVKEIINKF